MPRKILIALVAVVCIIVVSVANGQDVVVTPGSIECAGTTQQEHREYAFKKYTSWRTPLLSKKAKLNLKRMQVTACSVQAGLNMRKYETRLRAFKPKPPYGTTQHCVLDHESGFFEGAINGQYKGISQSSAYVWARDGGLRFGPTPLHATYREQLHVFNTGFNRYGCDDWCPFDGC